MAASFDAQGQGFSFSTETSGNTSLTVGATRSYSNVITIGGQQINAVVTLTGLTSGTTLTAFDSTTNPSSGSEAAKYLQPNLSMGTGGGRATFTVDFYANGSIANIRNIFVNTYDLDASSGGPSTGRQYTDFSSIASYTISSSTLLTVQTPSAGVTRFIANPGISNSAAPGTVDGDKVRARVFFSEISGFSFEIGDTVASGSAYFGIDFSSGPTFQGALDTTPPVITFPSNAPGATTAAITVNENQTAVQTLLVNEASTWSIVSGNDGAKFSLDASGVLRFVAAPDFEVPTDSDANNSYIVVVAATDTTGNASANLTITVTVADIVDETPVFTAPNGPGGTSYAFSYAAGQAAAAVLGTVAATDAEGGALTYAIASGDPGGVTPWFAINSVTGAISITTAGAASLANDFALMPNTRSLSVTVSDGSNITSIPVALTETAGGAAPVITGPSGAAGDLTSVKSVSENQTAVTTLSASPATSTWSLTSGADQLKFAIDPTTGVLTFVAAPNFEIPTDTGADNSYVVTVTATEAGVSSSQTVTVTVTDLDELAPIITGPSGGAGATASAIAVNENQIGVSTLTANETVTWSLVGGTDQGKFSISAGGVITFQAAPDYEAPTDSDTNNIYVVQVRATDTTSNFSDQTVTVTVANLDELAPIITGPSDGAGAAASAITVNENQPVVTTLTANEPVTWSIVGGSEQAKFSISAGGVLTFLSAPDYEAPTDTTPFNTYMVQVCAADTAGNVSSQTITVTVANLDEVVPIISGPSGGPGAAVSAITVNENQTGVTTLSANEPVTWSLAGGSDQGKFSISTGGVISFQAAPNYEAPADSDANNIYLVQVRARDASNNDSFQTVTVTVADLLDTPPIISSAPTVTVDENQTAVTTLSVNRTVGWSIVGGSDQGAFSINVAGVLTFLSAPDYENPADSNVNNSYIVQVSATDSLGNIATSTVTVLIRNLEDSPPIAGGGTASISGRITRSSGPAIAGVVVELVDGTGRVIATALSQGGGFYAFSNIPAGDYGVRFNTSTGIMRSHADVGTQQGNVVTNISVTSGTDIQDVDAIVLDPSGVIYDSIQRTPISGALVSFYFGETKVSNSWLDTTLGGLNDQTTDSTGFYSFVLNGSASSGIYELRVTAPSGYANATSLLIAPGGTLTTALGGGIEEIQPQATAPLGGQSTLYYKRFTFTVGATLATTSNGVVKNHIPLDPIMTAALSVTQNATEAGQPARFTVALNRTNGTGSGLTFDIKDLASGTASAGTDHPALLANQQLVVPSGYSSGTFDLVATDDAVVDPDETVSLQISNPSVGGTNIGAFTTLTTDLGTALIFDNDNAPVFMGTNSTLAGKPAFSLDYPENQLAGAVLGTAAATDEDGNSLTYTISAGDPGGSTPWFVINSAGQISLTAAGVASVANDFEQLANGQSLTVTVTDGANPVSIAVVLNETNTDDIPPVITGAGNQVGLASAITVKENLTAVIRLTSDKVVTWSLVGGADQVRFKIDPATGVLTFAVAPDFELPIDADTNNIYLVQVQAKDAAGNISLHTVTVTVEDVDDTAALITGPSGGAGAKASGISVFENQTGVTTLLANEKVTWALAGGEDQSQIAIDPALGVMSFKLAPDYETPTDGATSGQNTYIAIVSATDMAGNVSLQTVTVTVANIDEITQKLAQIAAPLRNSLRNYAFRSLSDMLSFNERLLAGGVGGMDNCLDPSKKKALSGGWDINQSVQAGDLAYTKRLDRCDQLNRVYLDAGLSASRTNGEMVVRGLGSLRVERDVRKDLTLGAGLMATYADDHLSEFTNSTISDRSLQLNLYGRKQLTPTLRMAAFAGLGQAWYDFGLTDDGLTVSGKMVGNRQLYGASLSGDIKIKGASLTTDLIISRAMEDLGNAKLAAKYQGESRSGIALAVGKVDVTRVNIPVHIPFDLKRFDRPYGSKTRFEVSPGLLCEDNAVYTSGLQCGFKADAKFVTSKSDRSRTYVDLTYERVRQMERKAIGLGYARRYGRNKNLELSWTVRNQMSDRGRPDGQIMMQLKVGR